MRYAFGILFGALITGVMFIGASIINVLGFGVTDPVTLQALWGLYTIWFFVCVILLIVPLLVVWFTRRDMFKEILFFEVGGFALFAPIWLCFAAEVSGYSIVRLITVGVENALPSPGPGGALIGVTINALILDPIMVVFMLLGIYILRPSFVYQMAESATRGALRALSTTSEGPSETEPSAAPEEPTTPPPVTDETTKQEMIAFLNELGIAAPMIQKLVAAGYASVTELVATSPAVLAKDLGVSEAEAKTICKSIQDKQWFGGISE